MPTFSVFACRGGLFVNGTEAQERVVNRIVENKMSLSLFASFNQAVSAGRAKGLSYSRIMKEYDGQGMVMCVTMVVIKE